MSDDEDTLADKPSAVARPRQPSQPASRYATGDEIARGGMGRVVEAKDTLLDRVVAVKEALTLEPELLRRFARETKITARLEHPSIVPVYDAKIDGDAPFYVMRRVSGRPLSELIDDAPTLADRLALVPHVLAAAQAVAHAHRRGVIHRDIKPPNILAGDLGETVVIDWGLAKVIGEDDDDPVGAASSAGDSLRTHVGAVVGTAGFMSQAQLNGEPAGTASDVYALGATLYNVLSGKPPHHARGAEAMMAAARAGPPMPIAQLVPGVPRELSTIVDTALAYGKASYPDAGAFAEDLRRFLTGQLVASHAYSRRERLWRFVRKHRAAVGIGLAAVVVLAIVGTVSILRVIAERDRADEEARAAEAAQRRERERADQMLLYRAAALVETNPTAAVAALKDLDASSPLVPEAHAIVNSAQMRGVAWAMKGPSEYSSVLALDASTRRLLQVTSEGSIRLWDLEQRRLQWTVKDTFGARVAWVGDRIVHHGRERPTRWLDPATGAASASNLPPLRDLQVSDDGASIVAVSDARELLHIDRASFEPRPLWPGHAVELIAVPGDGGWIAAHDGTLTVVLDHQGKVLASRPGRITVLHASQSRRLAILDDRGVPSELQIGTDAAWRVIPTDALRRQVVAIRYRKELLTLYVAGGSLLVQFRDELFEVARPKFGIQYPVEIGDHQLVAMSGGQTMIYLDAFGARQIALPHTVVEPRLTARRGKSRAIIASPGLIAVFDLEIPRHFPGPIATSTLLDDNTAVVGTSQYAELSWLDLSTGTRSPFTRWPFDVYELFDIDDSSGRILFVSADEAARVSVLTRGDPNPSILYRGALSAARLVPGGAIIGTGDRVLVVDGKTPREIVRLGSRVESVIWLGGTRFAAVSVEGELVRGELAGGVVERTTVGAIGRKPPRSSTATSLTSLVADADGHVIVGWGTRLLRWRDRLEQITTVDGEIQAVGHTVDGVFVLIHKGPPLIVRLSTGKPLDLPRSGEAFALSRDGRVYAFEVDGMFRFLDIASGTSWTSVIPHTRLIDLSPTGTRAISGLNNELILWSLPRGEGPLRDRLERLTNATLSSQGQLHWPWQ